MSVAAKGNTGSNKKPTRRSSGKLNSEREQELVEVLGRLDGTRDAERKTLSRDLHDTLVGMLSATKLECDWLLRSPTAGEAEYKRSLARVSSTLGDAVQYTRRVIDQLWPVAIAHLGLGPALEFHLSELVARGEMEIDVLIDEEVDPLPEAQAIALYRAVHDVLDACAERKPPPPIQLALQRRSGGIELRMELRAVQVTEDARSAEFDGALLRERTLRLGGRFVRTAGDAGEETLEIFLPLAA